MYARVYLPLFARVPINLPVYVLGYLFMNLYTQVHTPMYPCWFVCKYTYLCACLQNLYAQLYLLYTVIQ